MDEEEQEEEVHGTGSDGEIEEYTDSEEPPYAVYQSTEKLFDTDQPGWRKFSFLFNLSCVVISATCLIITYPLYLESIRTVSSAYTSLLFVGLGSIGVLAMLNFLVERISPDSSSARIRIPRFTLIKISSVYALSGILVTLSLDQDRVLCHLQDPIKGIVLVFSLVYYFFLSRKMMSLQRIFSSTTIVAGLFISVDYGLCDEFRCRGRETSAHAISVKGSWGVKAIWTFVYVGGLAIYSIYYTLLERHYTTELKNACSLLSATHQSAFLSTVSRLVSSRDVRRRGLDDEGGRLLHVTDADPTISRKARTSPKPPVLGTLLRIHGVTFILVLAFIWLDLLPGIGRGLPAEELYSSVKQGLLCHFESTETCSNISGYAWLFLISYVAHAISILNFLSMCESAVFSIAAATVSLPLSGIWWSIYRMDVGGSGGTITWSPGVTGELICALLGLPVVLLGLGLLVKSHLKDTELPSLRTTEHQTCHS